MLPAFACKTCKEVLHVLQNQKKSGILLLVCQKMSDVLKKNKNNFCGGPSPPSKSIHGTGFFSELVDPSRNRLVSTAYQKSQASVFCIDRNAKSRLNKKFFHKPSNRLNRKKNQIPDFSIFNCSSYSHFCSKN